MNRKTASQAVSPRFFSVSWRWFRLHFYYTTTDLLQLTASLPFPPSNSLRFIQKSNLKHLMLQRLTLSQSADKLTGECKSLRPAVLRKIRFLVTYFTIKTTAASSATVYRTSGCCELLQSIWGYLGLSASCTCTNWMWSSSLPYTSACPSSRFPSSSLWSAE